MAGARVAVVVLLAVAASAAGGGLAHAAAGQPRCVTAASLEKQGLLDDAKAQYKKALEDKNADPECGVTGLKSVADTQAAQKVDDKHVTAQEALDTVADWFLKLWPWLIVATILWIGYAISRALPPRRLAIRASKDDAEFAKAVLNANAPSGPGPAPAKLIIGGDETLPQNTVADLSKLLQLPISVPVGPLLGLLTIGTKFSLSVAWSSAGSWSVADVTLKRSFRGTRTARIALKLPAEQKAVALVAGAWLVTVLGDERASGPTRYGDPEAQLAHAYFRAGAALQAQNEVAAALACYTAMPHVAPRDAPFAWVGARLNSMMAFKALGRRDEAIAMAGVVEDAVARYVEDRDDREWFGEEELEDLKRRIVYLTAILWVDLAAESAVYARQADEAVAAMEPEIPAAPKPADVSLAAAMRMVALAHRAGELSLPAVKASVEKALGTDVLSTVAERAACAPLGGAPYYDAACAYAVVAEKACRRQRKEAIGLALGMLKLAVAATPVSQRPRLRLSAQSDVMLASIAPDKRFAAALGIVAPPPEADARLDVTLTEATAAAVA
jgi:hypothetical protein